MDTMALGNHCPNIPINLVLCPISSPQHTAQTLGKVPELTCRGHDWAAPGARSHCYREHGGDPQPVQKSRQPQGPLMVMLPSLSVSIMFRESVLF